MNKLVKSVKKLTKKMTLTHLLVALLVVALVVAVVHSQRNQENFSWLPWNWYYDSDYWRRQQEVIAKAAREAQEKARIAQLKQQYTRANWEMTYLPTQPGWAPAEPDSITKWVATQQIYLKSEDNGESTLQNGTWDTKCARRGKIDQSIKNVDLTIESANIKAIGEQDVYTDLNFKKCQAICDFHSVPETSKGQWEGGCVGFNITYHKTRGVPQKAECVFYSNPNSYNPPTSSIPGLTEKLNKRMRKNWNTKAKVEKPKSKWWGLNAGTAKWTYWPRKELKNCQ